MSIIEGSADGSKTMASKRSRLRDPADKRERDGEIFLLSLRGWTSDRIARRHRLTRRHVNHLIAKLPEAIKNAIRKEFRRAGNRDVA